MRVSVKEMNYVSDKAKRVLAIIGTRPEIIKMIPVIRALREKCDMFTTQVCSTGQHRELSDQLIEYFKIRIDYDLNIMKESQTLTHLTAKMLEKLRGVIEDFKPDVILVQGDTTTAFIGALAGYYQRVQVGHVEAGLRTYEKYAPFPEEMNRRLVGVLADHHFAPTERAKKALLDEGIKESNIIVTGNTVIDTLLIVQQKIKDSPPSLGELEPIVSNGGKIVLITGHRRENFGEGFKNICEAIKSLSQIFSDTSFIYPVHLNPNVQKPVYHILGKLANVHLIPPMGYVPFVRLMSLSHIILTDSGGIQEEASSLGRPVLVMREVTERPEAVDAGTAMLVGTERMKIVQSASKLITDDTAWNAMSRVSNPYGDGKAARRIITYLETIAT
jgi:UDP-N-acetylglucosamine 2-epimerase (non-hydrolysing)